MTEDMKCPKCGSGQGDLYFPIDRGNLAGEVWYYCDDCGYDELDETPTSRDLNTIEIMLGIQRVCSKCGHEEKVKE